MIRKCCDGVVSGREMWTWLAGASKAFVKRTIVMVQVKMEHYVCTLKLNYNG